MKAVVFEKYGTPQVVKIRDVVKPEVLEAEVLVKVYASSVTTADTMMRKGDPCFARLFLGLCKHKNPMAGTGFAGKVEKVGSKVTQFKIGDDVFGETGVKFGANAEFVCVSANDVISSLPQSLTYAEAAPICDGALTSWAFLVEIAQLKRGQHILIIGAAGSLGSAAVQIAKHLGAQVTGVCSTEKKELLINLGADQVIDYTQEDFLQNSQSYDVIYDTIGHSSYRISKGSLSNKGMYLSPVLSMGLLIQMLTTSMFKGKRAKFSAIGLLPALQLRAYLDELKALFKMGDLKSVMGREYSLEQAVKAHEYVDTGHKKGNVVLTMPVCGLQ